ncbi:FAD-dependent oxidoreductase [Methylocella sp.]|uniref:FAD-dependent oxidoreductase n=1 Tax=Methylocella sp. TaxID=1978226 RepID=UPI003782E718
MIIEATQADDGAEICADVCVIGGGAAGIALALALPRSLKVVLIEGGGLTSDPMSQSLYAGESVGLTHDSPADSRSRFLGGSTNCWGGWCRPLDPFDFERRPWVPHSGWPIRKADLEPYYRHAGELLELPDADFTLERWAPEIARLRAELMPVAGSDLVNVLDQLSPPTRMGDVYRERLRKAPNVRVLLHANVVRVATDARGEAATGADVATLDGKRLSIRAAVTVLAAGGVENARLLLASNDVRADGLANGSGLVGRFYMDHPRRQSTQLRIVDAARFRPLYDALMHRIHRGTGDARARLEVHLAPSFDAQRRLGLSNSRVYLVGARGGDVAKAYRAMKRIQRAINGRKRFGYPLSRAARDTLRELPGLFAHAPGTLAAIADVMLAPVLEKTDFTLESVIEPVPNPDSRVTLAATRDRLGVSQPRIDWRLTAQDEEHFRTLDRLVVDGLCAAGVATVIGSSSGPGEETETLGCWHHMGTTRMHEDPAQGVVDAQCRAHDVRHLYVAGSSVFPTVGSDSPTITLVALALRLADRIALDLKEGVARPVGRRSDDADARTEASESVFAMTPAT